MSRQYANRKYAFDTKKQEPVPVIVGKADPLICTICGGTMRTISFIEDQQAIRDILTHLGLWLVRSRPLVKGFQGERHRRISKLSFHSCPVYGAHILLDSQDCVSYTPPN